MAFGHGAILHSTSLSGGRVATAPVRTMWALGDYHQFARATVWELGPLLVSACKISAGQRVLDVAAGTGNVAIRAAQAGASAVASDLTPENFDAGRRAAREAGVELEWVEGDAAALPFADAEFDAVTSCFGAMFAADHQAVANELLRVCRPGGTIGMMNFTPDGAGQDFFRVLSAYAPPPPPSALPPLLWGTEEHVRKLFGEGIQSLKTTRREYVETASSPREYFELFKHAFGPMVAIYASLNDQPERIAELDARFLQFIARWNRGESEDRVRMPYEYLLVIARKRDLA
jgi:ubiquinone/menaquinone biosynthesis C-methylase UbiE